MNLLPHPWSRRAVLGLLAFLVGLSALNITNLLAGGWLPGGLVTQADFASHANVAAWFAAGVGIGVGLLAGLRAARTTGLARLRWSVIGAGCVGFGLADLLPEFPRWHWRIALAVLAVLWFLFLHRQLDDTRRAHTLFWLAAAIAVVNPAIDRYEIALAGAPENYQYVSSNQPYRMTAPALRRLTATRQVQEASEVLLLILVLPLILAGSDSKIPGPDPLGPVQGYDGRKR